MFGSSFPLLYCRFADIQHPGKNRLAHVILLANEPNLRRRQVGKLSLARDIKFAQRRLANGADLE